MSDSRPQFTLGALFGVTLTVAVVLGLLSQLRTRVTVEITCHGAMPADDRELQRWYAEHVAMTDVEVTRTGERQVLVELRGAGLLRGGPVDPPLPPLRELGYEEVARIATVFHPWSLPGFLGRAPLLLWPAAAGILWLAWSGARAARRRAARPGAAQSEAA